MTSTERICHLLFLKSQSSIDLWTLIILCFCFVNGEFYFESKLHLFRFSAENSLLVSLLMKEKDSKMESVHITASGHKE